MKITFFSTKSYDKEFFNKENEKFGFELEYFETHLGPHIVNAIDQTDAVCVFVNDVVSAPVIDVLATKGIPIIALRCAGFNNVDLKAAQKHGIKICRVPSYSPEAVAEHAVALILTLNRKTHKAYNRVREQNFSLQGLLGFELHGKTIGVIGTGKIGAAFCRIMLGFGCQVLAFDLQHSEELIARGVQYLPKEQVLKQSGVISLHCPLNEHTRHLVNKDSIAQMKRGVMLINSSRGGLVDTLAVIDALKSGQLGYLAIDVYEQEEKIFFRDLSSNIIEDDTIQRLMSFPNVLVTAHQAFFTREAMQQIASVTLNNVRNLAAGQPLEPKEAEVV